MTINEEQRKAAQKEADRLYAPDHTVDDPFGETGEARTDPYGYDEYANRAFVKGAEWQAAQDTKAESVEEDLAEKGRILASRREDLIVEGVDPAELAVPLYPEHWDKPQVDADKVRHNEEEVPGYQLVMENGKYTLVQYEPDGRIAALRYGEPWRDFIGDKFMYNLVCELRRRDRSERARQMIRDMRLDPDDPNKGVYDATWNSALDAALAAITRAFSGEE